MQGKLDANTHTRTQTCTQGTKEREPIGLVFIKAEKRGKVSSSHMRATFLNTQPCCHETQEEPCECRERVGKGKRREEERNKNKNYHLKCVSLYINMLSTESIETHCGSTWNPRCYELILLSCAFSLTAVQRLISDLYFLTAEIT